MKYTRRRVARFVCASVFALSLVGIFPAFAQTVRPIPPIGIEIPVDDRGSLTTGCAALVADIAQLKQQLSRKPSLLRYVPDAEIYAKAVDYALQYNEFYNLKEVATARELLAQGNARVQSLRAGKTPWMEQPGLVVLGYVSKIDGSVQPYGVVIPAGFVAGDKTPHRLDFFCHGRGEQLTELAFINDRQRNVGDFAPPDTFVLHPYGRYCNANRFAGEVDVFEALADIQQRFPIDSNRLVMRGFSMGGASAWQFATHHPTTWVAASPGAGFSETVGFLNMNGPGKLLPPWYEQQLFHWYDSIDYAVNLSACPTIAYSGDKDGQKQAADEMEVALAAEGLPLTRVIGKDTGHWYNPDSKKEIDEKIAVFAAKGRDPLPAKIRFTTWTLRYNKAAWLTVTGLKEHWSRARVDGELTPTTVKLTTENVTRFELLDQLKGRSVTIDSQPVAGTKFVRLASGTWKTDSGKDKVLRKKPQLQGPIDDAFMDRFVMVLPTGTPLSPATGQWVDAESKRAIRAWRATFRGDTPVKEDRAVTKTDIASGNLILWGDPSSNLILRKIADKLPIRWDKSGTITVHRTTYPAGSTVPVLIFPNPLNPQHYVVLNSGITWREEAYLNNDQQRARLPDWAILDISTPPDASNPGRVADAGFFDEQWQLQPSPEF